MIKLKVNNNRIITVSQKDSDGIIKVEAITHDVEGGKMTELNNEITAGEMVMLLNYYSYVKGNNIQCDFINSNGTN